MTSNSGEPGALLWRTTKGENAGRLLRICAACLRKDDWHVAEIQRRMDCRMAVL